MNRKIIIYLIACIALIGVIVFVFYPEPPQPDSPAQSPRKEAKDPIKTKLEAIRKRRENAPPEDRAREDMEIIYHVMREFERDKARIPESLEELISAKHTNGMKFLSEDKITDPWGSRYIYKKEGTKSSEAKIFCIGPDKIPDTADDMEGVPPKPLPSIFPATSAD
jgi:hypothetical protein